MSRATEFNHNMRLLGMVAPRAYVAAEDEPMLKMWCAHSRAKRVLALAEQEPSNSPLLFIMANGNKATAVSEEEIKLWKAAGEQNSDERLTDLADEAKEASAKMEHHLLEAERASSMELAETAIRHYARAYAYGMLVKTIRIAVDNIMS